MRLLWQWMSAARKEIEQAEKKAEKISQKHYTIDAKEEFVKDYIFLLLKQCSYEDMSLAHR